MKFILKDKHVFVVENHDLVYNKIEGELVFDEQLPSDPERIDYSVNGGLYKNILGTYLSIPRDEIKEPYFELIIRVVYKKEVFVYQTDKISLTHAVILGQPMENQYPKVIRALLEAVKRLETTQSEIIKVLEYLDTKGDIL